MPETTLLIIKIVAVAHRQILSPECKLPPAESRVPLLPCSAFCRPPRYIRKDLPPTGYRLLCSNLNAASSPCLLPNFPLEWKFLFFPVKHGQAGPYLFIPDLDAVVCVTSFEHGKVFYRFSLFFRYRPPHVLTGADRMIPCFCRFSYRAAVNSATQNPLRIRHHLTSREPQLLRLRSLPDLPDVSFHLYPSVFAAAFSQNRLFLPRKFLYCCFFILSQTV